MRTSFALAVVGALGLVGSGCGGGGAGGDLSSTAQPLVQGKVVSVDGDALALDGVVVECVNDGTTVTTARGGTFRIDVPAGERVRVRFRQRVALGMPSILPGGCTEGRDGTPDRGDLDDDIVEVEPLREGDVCGIEVELADGRVVECGVDRPHRDGPRFHGEGVLVPVNHLERPGPRGEVEVLVEDGCAALEVEAVHLVPGATYEVVLVSPDLAQAALGKMTADGLGAAHLRAAACPGDALPFGVASVADLAGFGVFVLDSDGVAVLAGQVPGRGHEWGEPGHDDGRPGDGHPEPRPHPLPPIGDRPDHNLPTRPDDDLADLLGDILRDNPLAGGLPGCTPR